MNATIRKVSSRDEMVRVNCPLCGHDDSMHERVVRGYALGRCRRCDMVFVNPQIPSAGIVEGYVDRDDADKLIDFYDRVTTSDQLLAFRRILGHLARQSPQRGRLLDFGCGACHFLACAQKDGWEAHGVEPGEWSRLAASRLGVRNFHQGLLKEQRFPDGFFDAICANQVLEHLPSPRLDLAEIHRVLRPGGQFYANVPNYRCLSIVLGCDDFELNFPMAHVNYFTPRTLPKLLRESGFDVFRTWSYGGLKLENLFGRRTISVQSRAHRGELLAEDVATDIATKSSGSLKSFLKKLAYPFVDAILYRWVKVGMGLEVFARRRH